MSDMTYPLDALTSGGGFNQQGVAGETLPAYKPVYLSNAGTWKLADASSESTMPAAALTVEAIPSGKSGKILLVGIVQNNLWSWVPGNLLYVSTSTGEITITPPGTTGNQVQVIGIALSQTLIIFNPTYVLVEVA